MKLLTLNTHSLIIPEHEAKREIFVNFIAKEQPEVFALQEVNQTAAAPLLAEAPAGYYPCPGNTVLLKADNHAAAVAKMLEARGVHYYWSWLPAKVGYDIYDEGAAVFSRAPITDAENLLLSQINDYSNWKTRRTLGICAGDVWYYTVHLGWWKLEGSQYGLLKHFSVTNEGSFVDGMKISEVTLDDLKIPEHHSIRVKIGVKEDAEHMGGMNIFGKGFGNYDQGIVLRSYFN